MLYRNRFYSPELGRFLQRDPIGYEAGDWNVYRYCVNNSLLLTDSNGMEPNVVTPVIVPSAQCSIDPCVTKCNKNTKKYDQDKCVAECFRLATMFQEWYANNRDITWTTILPDCPCTIEKGDDDLWKDQKGFCKPNRTPIFWGYHKGADLCTRGDSNQNGNATQCCYSLSEDGKTGKLITSGSGQGSADKGKTGLGSIGNGKHRMEDMLPANWAWFLDGDGWGCHSKLYMRVRPLIYSGCEDNPTPPLGGHASH